MKTPAQSRLDLNKTLDSGSYDHAIILTYTFDPLFFEDYCLVSLDSLQNCKTISVCLDRSTYDKIIGDSQMERPKQANLRYLLHPVAVPGVFHPKMVLLASANRGRLIIGSANLTRPGLTSNAELVATYDFKANEKEMFAAIFRSAFGFVRSIAERWPTRNLTSNLQEIVRESPWLADNDAPLDGVELLSNLDSPLLAQLISRVSGSVHTVSVVSRYFDQNPNFLERLATQTGARKIKIFTQNHSTNLPPAWLEHPLFKSGRVEIYLADYSSEEGNQSLHGKTIVLETSKGCLLAFGSANCTTPALLKSAKQSNVELLLAIQLAEHDAAKAIPRVMDPEKNARKLTKASDLVSVAQENEENLSESFPVEILEAEADKDEVVVWLTQPLQLPNLNARLEFAAGSFLRIPIEKTTSTDVPLQLGKDIAARLSQNPTVISFEDRSGVRQSNRVLITNLLDVRTGTNARKARYVKEAEQNAAGLLSVLNDLRAGSDEDALRTFLMFCDIPLVLGARAGWRSKAKEANDARGGMRSIGAHNFKIALSLHELSLDFCERHFRKLRRHVANRRLDGTPNFLHIALAIGGVLQSQIDRALSGLEARDRVTTEEWAIFRSICDQYFSHYRDLRTLIWEEYLSKMLREYPIARIREAFEPELEPLNELAQQMTDFRTRVEKLRTTKCLTSPIGQKGVPFGYFQSVFNDERWPKFAGDTNAVCALINSAIIGTSSSAKRAGVGIN